MISNNIYLVTGAALTQLTGISQVLREKTRLAGSNEQNRKQYQEYQNTIATQNAGSKIDNKWYSNKGVIDI